MLSMQLSGFTRSIRMSTSAAMIIVSFYGCQLSDTIGG
ncbi:MAG: hypothetical protein JWR37_1392 [Mycobacterium sp.]|jgi:hypothetical protein|nr:hypothetical protein [Mycobacterium sp.]